MVRLSWGLATLLLYALSVASENSEKETVFYREPSIPAGAFLATPIHPGELKTKFIVSEAQKADGAKYDGEWSVSVPETSAVEDDWALVLESKAKHHAIITKLDNPVNFDTKEVVVQYEVKFEKGMDCGGAYVKLVSQTADQDLKKFHDKTPYTIMFGPDRCGVDSKLHFIFRHRNPISGEVGEKALTNFDHSTSGYFTDKMTHLYTLVLRDDNSFEIFIDQKSVKKGSLLEDFTPPVTPPKMIPDPNSKKPDDWDEREKIADASAVKPDDWDENAPEFITDEAATKPDGWLDDEPTVVPDPEAVKPDDWDKEIDGDWEPPSIPNPKCQSAPGCGEWKAPRIHNPAYKGKWTAPMVNNPNYRGVWKPDEIPNPNFFEDKHPFRMTPIVALGLELWTMTEKIVFDNFLIVNSKEAADQFAKETWAIKHEAEIKAAPSSPSVVSYISDKYTENPTLVIGVVVAVAVGFLGFFYLLWRMASRGSRTEEDSRTKKDDDLNASEDDAHYAAAGPAANNGTQSPCGSGDCDLDKTDDEAKSTENEATTEEESVRKNGAQTKAHKRGRKV